MHRREFLSLVAAGLCATPSFAQDAVLMREIYNQDGSFSEFGRAHDGQAVVLEGFMAPPLKAESSFFVLTKMPMSFCPFCDSEATWPRDIVSVYSRDVVQVTPFNVPIKVSGVLRLGTYTDDELGFVSRVRLTEAKAWRV